MAKKKKLNKKVKKSTKKKKTKKTSSKLDIVSREELKEQLLVTNYKLAMARAQISALSDILIKSKIATFEEIWKKTNEKFEDSKL